jgi:hypothetical protein
MGVTLAVGVFRSAGAASTADTCGAVLGRNDGGACLAGASDTGPDVTFGGSGDGTLLVRAWAARLAIALGRSVAGDRLGRVATRLATSDVSRAAMFLAEGGIGVKDTP